MITDWETNIVYIADTLQHKYPVFFKNFENELLKEGERIFFLENTKDIWCVDYMPIQITKKKFVKFIYKPDYLCSGRWLNTITEVYDIAHKLKINYSKADIIIDGGNLIKSETSIILTDKIFRENPHYSKKNLLFTLQELFEVEKIIVIPTEKEDYVGHSDGMVRFINNETVLINDYSKTDKALHKEIRNRFLKEKLNIEYLVLANNYAINDDDASGYYINYLETEKNIFLPVFNFKEDEIALKQLKNCYPNKKITSIISNEIAVKGGVLNCITWNIKK